MHAFEGFGTQLGSETETETETETERESWKGGGVGREGGRDSWRSGASTKSYAGLARRAGTPAAGSFSLVWAVRDAVSGVFCRLLPQVRKAPAMPSFHGGHGQRRAVRVNEFLPRRVRPVKMTTCCRCAGSSRPWAPSWCGPRRSSRGPLDRVRFRHSCARWHRCRAFTACCLPRGSCLRPWPEFWHGVAMLVSLMCAAEIGVGSPARQVGRQRSMRLLCGSRQQNLDVMGQHGEHWHTCVN
jgi:hypothetical protein